MDSTILLGKMDIPGSVSTHQQKQIRTANKCANFQVGYICHQPKPDPAKGGTSRRPCSADEHLDALEDDLGK